MYLATNDAYSTLLTGISDSATAIQVAAGTGDRFPVIAGSNYTLLVISDGSGNKEVVKVTARSAASDSMTVVRGWEGTTARAWLAGDVVECSLTAGLTQDAMGHASESAGAHAASAIANTPAGNIAATTVQAAINELDADKEPAISILPVAKGGTGVGTTAELVSNLGVVTQTPGPSAQIVFGALGVSALPAGPTDVVNKEALEKAVAIRPLERQTIISGKVDSATGLPAYLNGTGSNRARLLLDTSSGAKPFAVSAAYGFGLSGEPIDETLTVYGDTPNVLSVAMPDNTIKTLAYSAEPTYSPESSAAALVFNNPFTGGILTDALCGDGIYTANGQVTHAPSQGKFANGSMTTPLGQLGGILGTGAAGIQSMAGTAEFFAKVTSDARNATWSSTTSLLLSLTFTFRSSNGTQTGWFQPHFRLQSNGSGTAYRLNIEENGTSFSGTNFVENGAYSLSFDAYHHIAYTYSFAPIGNQIAATLNIFVDGGLYLTKSFTSAISPTPSQPTATCLANLFGIFNPNYSGVSYIDDFAWFSNVRYTATFTPPTSSYVINSSSSNVLALDYPFQYGPTFDRKKNILLRFAGATSEIEDFGGTWSNFGTASPSGGIVTFDGTSMYLQSTYYTFLGQSEWTIEFAASATMGAASSVDTLLSIGQASTDFGVLLQVFTNAGATAQNLRLYLSSDGATHDIANGTLGSATLPSGTLTHISISFDGSFYKVYQAGVEVISVASTKRITNFSKIRIGWNCAGTAAQYLTGSMSWFRYIQGTVLYRAAFTASLSEPTAVGQVFWFDTANRKTKRFDVPAATSGAAPSFVEKKVVELGRAITAGAGVDTVLQLFNYGFSAFPSSSSLNNAKAWVSFDGTGTVSVKAGYNISSITDNGAGDWTINFTLPMRNANYIAVGNVGYGEQVALAAEAAASLLIPRKGSAKQTTSLRIGTIATDYPEVMVAVFGE